ncbi:hypothetical protein VTN00DRAFT_3104 [Thermoascus crustaceus]|uniref:uncharacterized protein n=1 Tax=Thermoascus crustaceus TaxID=5088 RepID=UPI003743450E
MQILKPAAIILSFWAAAASALSTAVVVKNLNGQDPFILAIVQDTAISKSNEESKHHSSGAGQIIHIPHLDKKQQTSNTTAMHVLKSVAFLLSAATAALAVPAFVAPQSKDLERRKIPVAPVETLEDILQGTCWPTWAPWNDNSHCCAGKCQQKPIGSIFVKECV